MSTPSFGQPPAFGAPVTGPPEPVVEPEPEGRGKKTVVIAVAAGAVALGVLGGAAALVLGGGGDDDTIGAAVPQGTPAAVEPATPASTPPSPLPTAAVLGRNVFVPLVEAGSGEASAAAAPVAAPEPAPSPTASPTALPTDLPVLIPAPAVTQVVEVPVPGPTTVVTQPVPGPTVTTGPTQQVDRFAHQVEVVAVEPLLDDDGAPVLKEDQTPDSVATYRVNGTEYEVQEGEVFLQVFQHVDLVTVPDEEGGEDSASVMFSYASSLWTVPVGTNIGLGPR